MRKHLTGNKNSLSPKRIKVEYYSPTYNKKGEEKSRYLTDAWQLSSKRVFKYMLSERDNLKENHTQLTKANYYPLEER